MDRDGTRDLDDMRSTALGRLLPRWCGPYLALARMDRPIGWWLLLLPGWVAIVLGGIEADAAPGPVAALMLLFWAGAVAMRSAGCVVNDLWDRDLDARVERTRNRPIASGAVSIPGALAFLALLGLAGLAVLAQLPRPAIITGLASLPLVVLYPLAKRLFALPQIVLALVYSWGALLGWAAHGAFPGMEAAVLYLATAFWVFGYDTIYAIQDMRDDRAAGIHSSAIALGRALRPVVVACYAAKVLLLLWLGVLLGTGPAWNVGVVLAGIHLARQVARTDIDDPRAAGAVFRSNRDTGLILTAGALAEMLLTSGA